MIPCLIKKGDRWYLVSPNRSSRVHLFYKLGNVGAPLFHLVNRGYFCFIQHGGRGVSLFALQYVQQLRFQRSLKALPGSCRPFTEWLDQILSECEATYGLASLCFFC